ncbi:hypothetical protein GCM10023085_47280 [Actinomadura viridis]|uniref:Lipoprotein n=1 Tax=Actinomadura viridis TaxID=58110 RepID=A0A931GPM3_9ACTN|nr:hypothetical protein [Actinomadura viridis]MBG6090771.1 hypothetical protein [Actinomadura viridis]
MRSPVRRWAALAVVLLAACGTVVGCAEPDWKDRYVDERVSRMMTESLTRLAGSRPEYPGVPMRNLTPFAWDGLFFFESGPQGGNVRDKTGFSILPEREYVQENHSLLVFLNGPNLAKVVLLKDGLSFPLYYANGKKYSSQARMISMDGKRVMKLVEPTAFQRLYHRDTEFKIIERLRTLRDERKKSVPIGDLGFAWDEMRVIEPRDLKKKTGLSYAGLEYRPSFSAFMVFSHRGRVVRIAEMGDMFFPPEHRRAWHGRKWGDRTMIVAREEWASFTLREP